MKSFSLAMTRFYLLLFAWPLLVFAQDARPSFDTASKVFRLDGGPASYVFGVNTRGELQQLYWGGRLGATDRFTAAQPMPECLLRNFLYQHARGVCRLGRRPVQ
jgi:hypothetical protein